MYIRNEAIRRSNKQVVEAILNGGIAEQPDLQMEQQNIQNELSDMGNQRFYSPGEISWKEYFKDVEWDLEVDITGEQAQNQNDLATLNTVFTTIAANPQILQTKDGKMIFNKILEKSGTVSPAEISMQPSQISQELPQQAPQSQPVPN